MVHLHGLHKDSENRIYIIINMVQQCTNTHTLQFYIHILYYHCVQCEQLQCTQATKLELSHSLIWQHMTLTWCQQSRVHVRTHMSLSTDTPCNYIHFITLAMAVNTCLLQAYTSHVRLIRLPQPPVVVSSGSSKWKSRVAVDDGEGDVCPFGNSNLCGTLTKMQLPR